MSTPGVTPIKREGGKQVYRLAFSYRGVQCREIVALPHSKANEAYCRRLREKILGEIERGEFAYATHFPQSKRATRLDPVNHGRARLLRDALEAYRDRVKATFSHSSFQGTRKAIDNVLVPWCGDIAIGDIRPSHIREWAALQTTSLKRIRNVLLPLRAVLDEAVADGVIDSTPFAAVKLSKLVPEVKRRSQWEPNPYTEAELRELLGKLPEPERWVFQAWAYTGLRTGELVGLRWTRVDMAAGTLRVVETTTERRDKDRPKTPSGVRTIALLPAAVEALEHLQALAGKGQERVAINPRSTRDDKAWDDKRLAGVWQAAHKDTKIAYRNPYQLRHTFASHLLSQGEPPAKIAALLGHKTAEMVLRVYARWVEQADGATDRRYGATRLWGCDDAN